MSRKHCSHISNDLVGMDQELLTESKRRQAKGAAHWSCLSLELTSPADWDYSPHFPRTHGCCLGWSAYEESWHGRHTQPSHPGSRTPTLVFFLAFATFRPTPGVRFLNTQDASTCRRQTCWWRQRLRPLLWRNYRSRRSVKHPWGAEECAVARTVPVAAPCCKEASNPAPRAPAGSRSLASCRRESWR